MQFKPGNLVQISIKNFRGVRDLKVKFSPHVNYFIAPNGHGKSSVLMAIQLAFGSDNKELDKANKLIYEGEESASIELWVAIEMVTMTPELWQAIRDDQRISSVQRFAVVIAENGFKFSHNFRVSNRAQIQKLAYKLSVFVDNPFATMTQLEAQKVMDSSGEMRLEQLILLVDESLQRPIKIVFQMQQSYKPFYERYSLLVKNFLVQKTIFSRGMINFRGFTNVEILRKRLVKVQSMVQQVRLKQVVSSVQKLRTQKKEIAGQLATVSQDHQQISKAKVNFQDQIELKRKDKTKQYNEMQNVMQEGQDVQRQIKVCYRAYEDHNNKLNSLEITMKKQKEDTYQQIPIDLADYKLKYQNHEKEIIHLRKQLNEITSSVDQQGDISQIMSGLNDQLRKSEQKLQQFYNERSQIMKQRFVDWFNLLTNRLAQLLQRKEDFLIFPTIVHMAVDSLCVIPISTAKRIISQTLGGNLFASITNSYQVSSGTTMMYSEVQNTKEKASQVIHLKEYEQLSYVNSFKKAQQQFNQQVIQRDQRKLVGTSLKRAEYAFCDEILIGNPIVVNNFNRILQNFVYINDSNFQGNDQEITKILSNNQAIKGIFYKEKCFSIKFRNGQVASRSIDKLKESKPIEGLLKQLDVKQFQHEILLENDVTRLKQEKSTKEQELQNQHNLINERKDKINNLNRTIHQLQVEKGEFQNQIFDLERRLNTIKPVTEKDVDAAKEQVELAKCDISRLIGRLVSINEKVLTIQFGGADLIKTIQKLEAEVEQLSARQIALKTQLDEFQRQLSSVEKELQSQEQNQETMYKQMEGLPDLNQPNVLEQYLESEISKLEEDGDLKAELLEFAHVTAFSELSYEVAEAYSNTVAAKIASRTKQQDIDLQAEFDKTKQIAGELFTYQLIMLRLFAEFASAVRICEGQLKEFVQKVSGRFAGNLMKFGVSGELELSLWKKGAFVTDRRENDKLLRNLESPEFVAELIRRSHGPIAEELLQFYQNYEAQDYVKLLPAKASRRDRIEEEAAAPLKFVEAQFLGCFASFEALDAFLKQYAEPEVLNRFQKNFDAFTPQLQVKTQFARGEKLQHASLSGGEKSVASLCLAACADQAAFNLIDEINQGMDEKFERAAHELICRLQNQVVVSSPKLGPALDFGAQVRVHCLIGQVQ